MKTYYNCNIVSTDPIVSTGTRYLSIPITSSMIVNYIINYFILYEYGMMELSGVEIKGRFTFAKTA